MHDGQNGAGQPVLPQDLISEFNFPTNILCTSLLCGCVNKF